MPLYLQNRQACLSIRHRSMKKSYSLESTVVIPFTQGLQWAAVPLWVAGPPASFPCTRAHSPDSSCPTCSTSARAQHTGVMRLSLFTISHKGWQGKAFNLSYWTGQYKTQLHFKFILLIGLVVLIIKRKGTEEMRKREKKTLKIMEKKLSNTSEFLKERECYWAKSEHNNLHHKNATASNWSWAVPWPPETTMGLSICFHHGWWATVQSDPALLSTGNSSFLLTAYLTTDITHVGAAQERGADPQHV